MKTIFKILTVSLIIFIVIFSGTEIFGAQIPSVDPDYNDSTDRVTDITAILIGTIQIVAMVIAVILIIVLAIKYMTASPSDRADIKKSAVIYVAGAIILFTGSALLEILQDVGSEINSAAQTERI